MFETKNPLLKFEQLQGFYSRFCQRKRQRENIGNLLIIYRQACFLLCHVRNQKKSDGAIDRIIEFIDECEEKIIQVCQQN